MSWGVELAILLVPPLLGMIAWFLFMLIDITYDMRRQLSAIVQWIEEEEKSNGV